MDRLKANKNREMLEQQLGDAEFSFRFNGRTYFTAFDDYDSFFIFEIPNDTPWDKMMDFNLVRNRSVADHRIYFFKTASECFRKYKIQGKRFSKVLDEIEFI